MLSYRIGIDVGGTFTDLFAWSDDGAVSNHKVLSTPEDPSIGVMDGLRAVATARGVSMAELARTTRLIVHGTTVTTNAVLTRGGARTGLLTTAGVRDALEMRRGIREEQYDNHFPNVVPLVPRRRRIGLAGRLDHHGAELSPLRPDEVRAAVAALRADGVEAVAICFMHAYANDAQEREAAAIVAREMPEAFLARSSHVLPTIRFYDRVSTTVLDAYVGPVLARYLDALTSKLSRAGFGGVLLIMQSNGGVAGAAVTKGRPAMTLLSGPAAGPQAAAAVAAGQDRADCILVDMGGTSFDASLVRDGSAALCHEGEIDRLRIALPMLQIATIGAGGGSIGWIDAGGLLRMGPMSAGAMPGPACYGRGGTRPTCTDADLLLGYLDPDDFAGGAMRLHVDAARRVVAEGVAEPLGLSLEAAAAGMYRVINTNMTHGVRQVTVKRGLDPREFPLVVAGGAGPLHACMIARELELPMVIVPATASTLCATGMLLCDLQHDFVRSCVGPLASIPAGTLQRLAAEMAAEGEAELAAEGASAVEHRMALDLRYLKQYHEVTVPVPGGLLPADGDLSAVTEAFHREHDRLYGYHLEAEGTGLELINVRLRSVGRGARPELPRVPDATPGSSPPAKGKRRAFVPEADAFADVPVFDGHRLRAGHRIAGPALVDRTDTTIFVSATYAGRVDALGSLVLEPAGR